MNITLSNVLSIVMPIVSFFLGWFVSNINLKKQLEFQKTNNENENKLKLNKERIENFYLPFNMIVDAFPRRNDDVKPFLSYAEEEMNRILQLLKYKSYMSSRFFQGASNEFLALYYAHLEYGRDSSKEIVAHIENNWSSIIKLFRSEYAELCQLLGYEFYWLHTYRSQSEPSHSHKRM